jgi:23S rRNA (uracil1939-C5)-methyltransferase
VGRRVIVGFAERASDRLVEISGCPVAAPALSRAVPALNALGVRLAPEKGVLDIAASALDNGIDVALRNARRLQLEDREAIAEAAVEHGFVRVTVDGDPLIERARPTVRFGDVEVTPPPAGFLQPTAVAEDRLAELTLAALEGAAKAADLYCGSGAFALRLARRMPVLAAEADEASLAALDHAASRTPGLKPVETRLRNLVKEPISAGELIGCDAAVVDPPRSGADAQMRMLAASGVSRIASISCNPKTFARDAATLIESGFRIGEVVPIDQFRWTGHVEVFALFSR